MSKNVAMHVFILALTAIKAACPLPASADMSVIMSDTKDTNQIIMRHPFKHGQIKVDLEALMENSLNTYAGLKKDQIGNLPEAIQKNIANQKGFGIRFTKRFINLIINCANKGKTSQNSLTCEDQPAKDLIRWFVSQAPNREFEEHTAVDSRSLFALFEFQSWSSLLLPGIGERGLFFEKLSWDQTKDGTWSMSKPLVNYAAIGENFVAGTGIQGIRCQKPDACRINF